MSSEAPPKLRHLDHVAIRVKDLDASVGWYRDILGLRVVRPVEWGPFPVMVWAGKSGIALFPEHEINVTQESKDAFHIAFNIDLNALDAMRRWLKASGIPTTFEDHHYYHSIYFRDPDGYRLEITAEVRPVPE